MSLTQIDKRSIGVNFNADGPPDICVWAPAANTVLVEVNDSVITLTHGERGYWHAQAQLQEGDEYRIVIDGKKLPDPASLFQPKGVHGPSVVVDLSFEWTDAQWVNPPLADHIFYEVHTGTFTHEGSFEAIIEKLPYLKELGITTLEVMPLAQFPGDRNWGYDGVFPFAVQYSYGGARALQRLVNECHQQGLSIVLDVVYNHLGPDGNYLPEFGPYFTDKYKTPWGSALNFDDAGCDGVRRLFIENALMWLRDFHFDGLRLDAVHAIKDYSAVHILREIHEHVNLLEQHTGRRYYLIAECDLNDPRFIDPVSKNGYGMNAQWMDEFHHALRVASGNKREGYFSDFNGVEHLAASYTDAYVYNGKFSVYRDKTFGAKTNNPREQFVVFSQNHDQVGNRMLGERSSVLVSVEMQKLMAAAVMVSPFLPLLFMGEEWGETNPFLYFVSHTNAELAEAVRKGRTKEFKEFHASGEAPDPNLESTFTQSKLQWSLLSNPLNAVMLNYYKALIRFRKSNAVLRTHHRENIETSFEAEKKILVLKRWHESQLLTCYLNFSKEEFTLSGMPQGFTIVFNSAQQAWEEGNEQALPHSFNVSPESILILKSVYV